jgi:hypothetical protein
MSASQVVNQQIPSRENPMNALMQNHGIYNRQQALKLIFEDQLFRDANHKVKAEIKD